MWDDTKSDISRMSWDSVQRKFPQLLKFEGDFLKFFFYVMQDIRIVLVLKFVEKMQ